MIETNLKTYGKSLVKELEKLAPNDMVMIQGEQSLCFYLVNKALNLKLRVVAACSDRQVAYKDGKKISKFVFEGFRPYTK